MIRRPPRPTPSPTRRSPDLVPPRASDVGRTARFARRKIRPPWTSAADRPAGGPGRRPFFPPPQSFRADRRFVRSEEHTSELQSRLHLVCRLLLEKKKIEHTT